MSLEKVWQNQRTEKPEPQSLYGSDGLPRKYFSLDHHLLDQRGLGAFDQGDQFLPRQNAQRRSILAQRRQRRLDMPSDPDTVISRYGDVFRYSQPPALDSRDTAKAGKIVRIQYRDRHGE